MRLVSFLPQREIMKVKAGGKQYNIKPPSRPNHLHHGLNSFVLMRKKQYRRLRRLFIDFESYFTILGIFTNRRGIIRAAASGNKPRIENTGFYLNGIKVVDNADDHNL